MSFRLQVGDRAPNFTLPDLQSAARMFYAQTRGQPAVLAFLGSIHDARTLDIIDALAIRSRAYGQAVQMLLIVQGTTAQWSTRECWLAQDSHMLVDATGKIDAAYR